MTDEEAIRAVAMRYADACGRLNAREAVESTYAENAVLMAFSGPEIVGRAAIAAALDSMLSKLAFLSQQTTGTMLRVEGDRAYARWTLQEWSAAKDQPGLRVTFGTYEDTLARGAEGWRFIRRRFQPHWRGTVPGADGKQYRPPAYELTWK
jgi:ketosteroid isomerase-like protein